MDTLIGIADAPTDDDDLRLRKRVDVVAGYVLILSALQLPLLAGGLPIGWYVAGAVLAVNAANLLVLGRTKKFDRYVVVLAASILLVAVGVEVALGGLNGSSAAIVFAFLAPVLALLGLGPRRATVWFVAFLAVVLGVILVDPILSSRIEPQPYPIRLVWYFANLAVPLGITFVLLRYTDLRRRAAEARSDELLTNAIPPSIASRLKRGETRIAETYTDTTVLFADLEGFTPWARATDPDRVVSRPRRPLQSIRRTRPALRRREGQDDRRCVHGGRRRARAKRRSRGGSDRARSRDDHDGRRARERSAVPLGLRVGLASGAVVGGVIGQRRILFDLWGDTVNTASRMQSEGIRDRIQVAPSTHALLAGPIRVRRARADRHQGPRSNDDLPRS